MNGCENTVTACIVKWVKIYIYIGVECSSRCGAHCSVNVGLEKGRNNHSSGCTSSVPSTPPLVSVELMSREVAGNHMNKPCYRFHVVLQFVVFKPRISQVRM